MLFRARYGVSDELHRLESMQSMLKTHTELVQPDSAILMSRCWLEVYTHFSLKSTKINCRHDRERIDSLQARA